MNAPEYQIRSVRDFLRVPRHRRAQCLLEFQGWLATVELAILKDPPSDLGPFLWTDDGTGGIRIQPDDRRPQGKAIGLDLHR